MNTVEEYRGVVDKAAERNADETDAVVDKLSEGFIEIVEQLKEYGISKGISVDDVDHCLIGPVQDLCAMRDEYREGYISRITKDKMAAYEEIDETLAKFEEVLSITMTLRANHAACCMLQMHQREACYDTLATELETAITTVDSRIDEVVEPLKLFIAHFTLMDDVDNVLVVAIKEVTTIGDHNLSKGSQCIDELIE